MELIYGKTYRRKSGVLYVIESITAQGAITLCKPDGTLAIYSVSDFYSLFEAA